MGLQTPQYSLEETSLRSNESLTVNSRRQKKKNPLQTTTQKEKETLTQDKNKIRHQYNMITSPHTGRENGSYGNNTRRYHVLNTSVNSNHKRKKLENIL